MDSNLQMKILHVCPSFFPATKWGGPIFSTKAICDWIAVNRPVEMRVLTTDAAGPARLDKLELRRQQMPAGYEVTYHPRIAGHSVSPRMAAALPAAIDWADVVHITSTYAFPTLPSLVLARLRGRPVIWSPRGAIQAAVEWEDAPKKRAKRIFERVAMGLAPRVTVLHVTAESEAAATARRMPGYAMAMIPNSIDLPESIECPTPFSDKVRIMFLSRIHEKKGLSILLQVFGQLPPNFELDIYGTGESDYLAQLQSEINVAGLHHRVNFRGHVDGASKTAAFAGADLFVLPSFSENFGIVVAEALAHGLPVITTDRTPWGALESQGCGICVPPEIEALRSAIVTLAAQDLAAMGARGRTWMEADFSPERMHTAMYTLYETVIETQRTGRPLQMEANT